MNPRTLAIAFVLALALGLGGTLLLRDALRDGRDARDARDARDPGEPAVALAPQPAVVDAAPVAPVTRVTRVTRVAPVAPVAPIEVRARAAEQTPPASDGDESATASARARPALPLAPLRPRPARPEKWVPAPEAPAAVVEAPSAPSTSDTPREPAQHAQHAQSGAPTTASGAPVEVTREAVSGPLVADDKVLLRIAVRDELSTWLRLVTVEISVDGKKVVSRADAEGIDAKTAHELYTAPVVPGSHTVTAKLVYKGRSAGVFAYMEGYTFRLSDSTTVIAEGQTAKLTVVAADRGATHEFEKRPMMKFER